MQTDKASRSVLTIQEILKTQYCISFTANSGHSVICVIL